MPTETTPDTIESLYERYRAGRTAIAPHLPRLRQLATGLELAVEFGVKQGASSTALLLGAQRVISLDVVETPHARALERIAGGRWTYLIQDSRRAALPPADLLFIDSLHEYNQVRDELAAHAHKILKYLVFHDVTTFGEIAAVGETGRQAWSYTPGQSVPLEHQGIRPAIDQFQVEHPEWRIAARYVDSHGLLVLERRL